MLLTNAEFYTKNYTSFLMACNHFGLTLDELRAVLRVMEYAKGDYLFKGPVATYSINDLLFGF